MIKIASNLDRLDFTSDSSDSVDNEEKAKLLSMIKNGGINSYLQPIVDLFTSGIYGYEMLARGEGDFFSPDKMFNSAIKNNTEWELEYACRLAALEKIKSLDTGFNEHFFFLNVSPHIFHNPEFQSGFTSKYIKEHGLNHRKIVLEITEKTTVEHYDVFEQLIKHYVEQGFKVALDDFGAGHSGLTTLVAMTPHFMKIDREIISDVNRSPYKQNLVRTLCKFASDVGSSVLAEGIETFEELETVYRLGVRYVQGYYLGRPSASPGVLSEDLKNQLGRLISRYKISSCSTSSFLNDIIIKPDSFPVDTLTCRELDVFFKRNQMADHIVIKMKDYPVKLITRQTFYHFLSGRFGFSLYANQIVEHLIHSDFLIINNKVDLLTIKKMALSRNGNEAFDPIIIIDDEGSLLGTITMKKLIEKAIDLEVYNAINQNPLTRLPGNSSIRSWLNQISFEREYTAVYIDIDHFKQYNDRYGFSCGDKMITLLSEILKEHKQKCEYDPFLGHVGGDDFILIYHSVIAEKILIELCNDFDKRKMFLFDDDDVLRRSYQAVSRRGEVKDYPLTTLSLAAFSNKNFQNNISSGELGHYAAELKSKVKQENYMSGKSGYIYERRIY